MPDELRAICPYWNDTCEVARSKLRAQGADCGFITKMTIMQPNRLVGLPPTKTEVETCVLSSLQQSLNGVHEGLNLILQILSARSSPPTIPFSKG